MSNRRIFFLKVLNALWKKNNNIHSIKKEMIEKKIKEEAQSLLISKILGIPQNQPTTIPKATTSLSDVVNTAGSFLYDNSGTIVTGAVLVGVGYASYRYLNHRMDSIESGLDSIKNQHTATEKAIDKLNELAHNRFLNQERTADEMHTAIDLLRTLGIRIHNEVTTIGHGVAALPEATTDCINATLLYHPNTTPRPVPDTGPTVPNRVDPVSTTLPNPDPVSTTPPNPDPISTTPPNLDSIPTTDNNTTAIPPFHDSGEGQNPPSETVNSGNSQRAYRNTFPEDSGDGIGNTLNKYHRVDTKEIATPEGTPGTYCGNFKRGLNDYFSSRSEEMYDQHYYRYPQHSEHTNYIYEKAATLYPGNQEVKEQVKETVSNMITNGGFMDSFEAMFHMSSSVAMISGGALSLTVAYVLPALYQVFYKNPTVGYMVGMNIRHFVDQIILKR